MTRRQVGPNSINTNERREIQWQATQEMLGTRGMQEAWVP